MKQISDDKKREIIKALEEHGANYPCPRCGNKSFALLGGYLSQTVQNDLDSIAIGGLSIPSIVVVCKKCGFLCQHSLGALGLLPSEEVASE
ncbi:MAG: hypothetical protein HQ591_03630 [candidate division Zixibacteria bacterium]|nr:hypothetical protein [Candidatus Tariuqbacter arcticus]